MANLQDIFVHLVMSPIAYHIFGRPRISRSQLSEVNDNVNLVLGILCPARSKLQLMTSCLEPSEVRQKATQLLEVLNKAVVDICAENSVMGNFWFQYDSITGRWSLTEAEIAYGRNQFSFWLDGGARKEVALLMDQEVTAMIEMGEQWLRRRQILARSTWGR